MTGAALMDARRARGWTQAAVAERLGVSQAYVCLLERNRRTVPDRLARKLAGMLELSPSALPLEAGRGPLNAEEASAALGALGYPGFAYVRDGPRVNPAGLVLGTLRGADIDARVVESVPWLLVTYPDLDWPWLLREAKVHDLQNRLGFLVSVARQLAELRGDTASAQRLAAQEHALEGSRLQREDAYRESMTDAERRWLREHRPKLAAHWNMLSTINARELADAFRLAPGTMAVVPPGPR